MITDNDFLGYVGIPDIHDATVIAVHLIADKLTVSLQSVEQRLFQIEFHGVESVTSTQPEGMMLYSISEIRAQAPMRRFVFANWDEQDDALLEVCARGFTIIDAPLGGNFSYGQSA